MSRYRSRKEFVSSRVLDGEAVLLSHETNHCFALNRTGTVAWEYLDRPEGSALEELLSLWRQPQRQDVEAMLDRLLEEGLIEPAPTTTPAPLPPAQHDYEPFQLEKYGTLEQLILSGE